MNVTASDADDPTYGSSARVVYSVLDGEKFFTVDRHTGKKDVGAVSALTVVLFHCCLQQILLDDRVT